MIYGIKQIEKQFPGFEARWTGAQLYDLSESFSRKNHSAETVPFSKEVMNKYFDMVVPPCEKMYLLEGKRVASDLPDGKNIISTEIAIESSMDFKQRILKINNIYFATYVHQTGKCLVEHLKNIELHELKRIGGQDARCVMPMDLSDERKVIKDFYGVASAESGLRINTELFREAINEILSSILVEIPVAFFYLNVRNIKQRTDRIPHQHQRGYYFPKAWGREYKVLSLSQTLTERSNGPDLPPGYHVRGHFQQGHFKRKPNGVYWWNPHWRGDFSKGIVMKDYKVKA